MHNVNVLQEQVDPRGNARLAVAGNGKVALGVVVLNRSDLPQLLHTLLGGGCAAPSAVRVQLDASVPGVRVVEGGSAVATDEHRGEAVRAATTSLRLGLVLLTLSVLGQVLRLLVPLAFSPPVLT